MKFFDVCELANNTKNVLSAVTDGNKIIVTDNNKPIALMIHINENNFEKVLSWVQHIDALNMLTNTQSRSSDNFSERKT